MYDPATSHMDHPDLQRMLYFELFHIANAFFRENIQDDPLAEDIYYYVKEFFDTYSSREFINNTGGSGFHNSFWLYVFSKIMDPNLIVESGVWKGHTAWLLQKANPGADVFGFDISFEKIQYKVDEIEYIEKDWGDFWFGDFDPDRAFVFFDCHVNHAKRILEAKEKGFKHLIFDDNPPIYKLYTYGRPGFPTVNMLNNQMIEYEELSWTWKDSKASGRIDQKQFEKAADLIKKHVIFPDVGAVTRYGGYSFLTYVEI